MKNNKKIFISASLLVLLATGFIAGQNNNALLGSALEDTSIWNHYTAVDATLDSNGVREYWVNCTTHEHVFAKPEVDASRIVEKGAPSQDFIASLPTNDDRLTPAWSEIITFEDNIIPSVLTQNAKNTVFDIVTEEGTNNKVLRTSGAAGYGFNAAKEYLDVIFADSNVIAVEFYAKATTPTNNFRRNANGTAITYELNNGEHGLELEWKSFHYTREYYDIWTANDIFVINNAGASVEYTYFDDIRPITEEIFGFENGWFRKQSPVKDSTYYTPGHGSYSVANPTAPDTKNRERYFSLLASDGLVTDVQWTAERASEGRYSLKVSKNSGYVAFYTFSNIKTLMGANGTFSFDVYSTIAARSDSEVRNFQDGMNGVTGKAHELGKWVTYTWTAENFTNDGRFLIIQGSTAGDWYFDNFRINYAA